MMELTPKSSRFSSCATFDKSRIFNSYRCSLSIKPSLCAILSVLVGSIGSVDASLLTWDNGASNSLWEDGDNWDGNNANDWPGANSADDAVISIEALIQLYVALPSNRLDSVTISHSGVTISGAGGSISTKTLTGGGTINVPVAITTLHNPGGDGVVGSQSFGSSLTYSSGATFSWDVEGTAPATSFDTVGGSASGTGGIFSVNLINGDFDDGFWNADRTWSAGSIFTVGGSLAAFSSVVSSANSTTQGSFTISASTLTWTTAVPEPTSAIVGLLLACGLFRRQRAI